MINFIYRIEQGDRQGRALDIGQIYPSNSGLKVWLMN